MAQILNPVNGFRGQLQADGKTVKNHMSLNRQIIKQKEEEVKQKLETAGLPKSKLKKSAVYFEQMRGKCQSSTKMSNQRYRDLPLLPARSQDRKKSRRLLSATQLSALAAKLLLLHSRPLQTSTKNRNELLVLINEKFWTLKWKLLLTNKILKTTRTKLTKINNKITKTSARYPSTSLSTKLMLKL